MTCEYQPPPRKRSEKPALEDPRQEARKNGISAAELKEFERQVNDIEAWVTDYAKELRNRHR